MRGFAAGAVCTGETILLGRLWHGNNSDYRSFVDIGGTGGGCRKDAQVALSFEAKQNILESRQVVDTLVDEAAVVYGITTVLENSAMSPLPRMSANSSSEI